MTPRDLAQLMLRKAQDDQRAMQTLASDPDSAGWVVGFHAQQAVEKALKAVLTAAGVRFRRTHDIHQLLSLIAETSLDTPEWAEEATGLGRFAVVTRYDDLETNDQWLGEGVAELVARVLEWATAQVRATEQP
jgi:HEPN domain-containing protein